jgi:hypothetical protein
MTVGTVAGAVASGAMLFKWGLSGTDRSNLRDAHALKESIKLLK